MNRMLRSPSRGFTLVELCVSVGIGAALLSQAVPAMQKLHELHTLKVHSQSLSSDLRFARAEARRLNAPVHFRVSGRGANACYLLHTGASNDCDCSGGQAVCRAPGSAVLKAQWLPVGTKLQVKSNAETMQFQHWEGLLTQTGSIDLHLRPDLGVRHVVAITGRARTCYTGSRISGMSKCA
ncbi:MAG: GspH/FimT family pseudopilin [Roseateles sp.]|jgi:Tfp pilus assembly protein FimT